MKTKTLKTFAVNFNGIHEADCKTARGAQSKARALARKFPRASITISVFEDGSRVMLLGPVAP